MDKCLLDLVVRLEVQDYEHLQDIVYVVLLNGLLLHVLQEKVYMFAYVLTLGRAHENVSELTHQLLRERLAHVLSESLIQFLLAGGVLAVAEVVSE